MRYNVHMRWLRRAWLWAIGCALAISGGSVLVMRFELSNPEPTLAPELYGHALALHGLMSLGMLIAAVLAIPTLVVKPGRGSVVLGSLALALWSAAIAVLIGMDVLGAQEWPGSSQQSVLRLFAGSSVLGAAQIVLSLPANADRPSRPQLVAALAGIAAIAIVVIPLAAGEVPTATYWLLATTAVACGVIPDATTRVGTWFAWLAIAPCLLLAWGATALLRGMHRDIPFHDTVGVLAPLPMMGGALLGALLLAATRLRSPRRRLVAVATALIMTGASVTSLGFFLLGARGLPRRYFAYLPDYQQLQILVGGAATIAAIGCLAALEAFRRGERVA